MPPPSSRMTKNRAQPTRYRPGKAEIDDPESEEDESEEEDDEEDAPANAPAPKASSFPAQKKQLAFDLSRAGQQVSAAPTLSGKAQADDLEGFVTASESSDEDGEDESADDDDDEESSEEEESSDDEPKRPMIAPKFISKAKRAQQTAKGPTEEENAAEAERLRQEKADEMLQAQLERDAAARAAGKKYWDDDDAVGSEPDTTDEADPEAELAAWKLRELKRVRRDRLAIEEKEKEREEIERRRNMTAAEREEEDRRYIEAQKEDREGKGKMAYMQKYFHKGAFFNSAENGEEQDEEVQRVLNRDLAGARFEDETGDKSVLPEYMRIRDMTRLGRKGRTKYKDLKNEDTGRWGSDVGRGKKREGDGLDERFRPDGARDGGRERTGANDTAVGERKKARYE